MTIIVGIQHSDGVTIGGDCAGTNGNLQQTLRFDDKVFRNGGYLIGFTSSYRMGQILRYADLPAVPSETEQWDLDRFMVTTFVDAVRSLFEGSGWLEKKSGIESGGSFLVGARGVLYTIGGDFQVGRSRDNYDAVGCGEDVAVGVLHFTRGEGYGVQERVTAALDAACHHSAGCAGPYTIETLRNERTLKAVS